MKHIILATLFIITAACNSAQYKKDVAGVTNDSSRTPASAANWDTVSAAAMDGKGGKTFRPVHQGNLDSRAWTFRGCTWTKTETQAAAKLPLNTLYMIGSNITGHEPTVETDGINLYSRLRMPCPKLVMTTVVDPSRTSFQKYAVPLGFSNPIDVNQKMQIFRCDYQIYDRRASCEIDAPL